MTDQILEMAENLVAAIKAARKAEDTQRRKKYAAVRFSEYQKRPDVKLRLLKNRQRPKAKAKKAAYNKLRPTAQAIVAAEGISLRHAMKRLGWRYP